MTEKTQYNEFIQKPSNSNLLINASLIIGFIFLIIAQWLLFRTMNQRRGRTSVSVRDSSGNEIVNTDMTVASSDIRLVLCADDDLGDAVAAVRPAVVNIDVTSSGVGSMDRKRGAASNFDMPPSAALESNEETLGSGIMVDKRGYVVTCHHLIKDHSKIYVTVFGSKRTTYEANVIEVDQENDLALLTITPDAPVTVAKLGNSDLVKITDTVLTVGSPFGFEHTVTAGIISDNKRSLIIENRIYKDLLQTDAAINRGSAGGALINGEGEVVGVNTAIVSGSDVFSGISFAIPINKVRSLLLKGR